MNFLVDAQLPPGLARWLADQGHSAQHVNDVGLAGAEDFVIWNHALGVDAIIVTKDEDFAEYRIVATIVKASLYSQLAKRLFPSLFFHPIREREIFSE